MTASQQSNKSTVYINKVKTSYSFLGDFIHIILRFNSRGIAGLLKSKFMQMLRLFSYNTHPPNVTWGNHGSGMVQRTRFWYADLSSVGHGS